MPACRVEQRRDEQLAQPVAGQVRLLFVSQRNIVATAVRLDECGRQLLRERLQLCRGGGIVLQPHPFNQPVPHMQQRATPFCGRARAQRKRSKPAGGEAGSSDHMVALQRDEVAAALVALVAAHL